MSESKVEFPIVVGKLSPPSLAGEPWTITIRCPYCTGHHLHGVGPDGMLLGHRLSHCGRGMGYVLAAEALA